MKVSYIVCTHAYVNGSIVIVSYIFAFVVCMCSGAEEWHCLSTRVESINQSINL